MKAELQRKDLVYPELSYKIVGCAFEVFKTLGPGLLEKSYQKAMAVSLRAAGLSFREQVKYDVLFHGEKVATNYFDFLVEDKVVIELKRGKFDYTNELEQVSQYLKSSGKQLGILIRFSERGVQSKRIVNLLP
ncbi:MAG TPA: GxxExxY protein [Bacteroidia bacterium]|jgi:GxxExxY protein|nr:GxxExxY protein [Bacteroidia bacterium]